MSKRSNAQISLKLDVSPKQTTSALPIQNNRRLPFLLKIIPLRRASIFSFLLGFIMSSFLYLSLSSITSLELAQKMNQNSNIISNPSVLMKPKLALVVPFRDRFDELQLFVPHLSKFLNFKQIPHRIWVINQVDSLRFNRASLINVGFLISAQESDYMIMHDVDLLPLNDQLDYSYPEKGPYHISASGLHPQYNYSSFIGGVLAVSKNHFQLTNGMSNRYWGWGKEDDEFGLRLKEASLAVQRPKLEKFLTGPKYTFRDIHDANRRPRDKKRFVKQKKEALKLDETGLSTLQYRIEAVRKFTFLENFECTVVDVTLFCDRTNTHWCSMDYQFFD